jgi:hypothetical protein
MDSRAIHGYSVNPVDTAGVVFGEPWRWTKFR